MCAGGAVGRELQSVRGRRSEFRKSHFSVAVVTLGGEIQAWRLQFKPGCDSIDKIAGSSVNGRNKVLIIEPAKGEDLLARPWMVLLGRARESRLLIEELSTKH